MQLSLLLPVIPFEERPKPAFLPPAESPRHTGLQADRRRHPLGLWRDRDDRARHARHSTKVTARNNGAYQYPWGIHHWEETITHEAQDDHPEATSLLGEHRMTLELDGRTLVWEAELSFTSDLENFYYDYTRRLLENGELVREKNWKDTIPRDHQ